MPAGACTRAAIAKATDWDTPGLFANAELYPILSEDLSLQIEHLQNDELGGCPEPGASDDGTRIVTGNITRYLHYSGDELMLALGMGSTNFTAGTPNTLGILRAGALTGLAPTIWLDKVVSTWKVDVAKVNSITITGGTGTPRCTVTYNLMGKAYTYNESVDWGTVSEPAANVNNFVLFRHLQYGINAQGGAAISFPTDNQALDSFEVTIENALAEDFRNNQTTLEPTRDGWGLVSGSVALGKYDDNNRFAQYDSQAAVKQLWEFTGAGDYKFRIKSPGAVLTAPSTPQIGGPGRIGYDYTWAGERATSTPSGMEAVDTHFLLDGIAADPLA